MSNDIRRDDQIPCSPPATRPAQERKLCQMFHAAPEMRRHASRSLRLVLLNVVLDFGKVRQRLLSPVYLHTGGGSLRRLPQDWR